MPGSKEKILVVENDPGDRRLIAQDALFPMGFRIKTEAVASKAIETAGRMLPDLIVSNFQLPDLSGRDLLVALKAQGLDMPFILIANKGQEKEVIQAFRLGASDYVTKPLREAEIVASVERALISVRARKEREALSLELQRSNEELARQVRDLQTVFALGKAVTSVTDQAGLFRTIVNGAIRVGKADRGYLLVRDEKNQFVLKASANLPAALAAYRNKPIDDGISSLSAFSGEPFLINGKQIRPYKISRLGQAAMVVPAKAQQETLGLIVIVRKKNMPFSESNRTMLEAVADYAAVSLVNARLFKALQERVQKLQRALDDARANPVGP